MSSNNQPLSGNGLTPLQRSSLNSLITNIILDADSTNSSFLIQTGNNSSFYIDKYSNVGINTTSPGTQFEVASANGACLRLRYGSTTAYSNIFMNSSGYLSLNPSGGEVNTNGNLNLTAHDGSTTGLKLGGTLVVSTAAQINYVAVAAGTAAASKAIVLDSSRNVSNINSLTASQLTGTLQTAAQPNITSVGTIASLTVGDITVNGSLNLSGGDVSTALGYLSGVIPGTASASKALVLDSSSNIIGLGNLGVTSIAIGGNTIGSTQSAYLTSITAGTASASKALVLDSSRNIININALTASQLTGTIQTAAQTNITSVGTLGSLTVSGATILSSSSDASSSSSGGALTISGGLAVGLSSFIGGNLTIGGNLVVNGTSTTVNATTVSVKDNILLLNSAPSGSYDGGILVQRYQAINNIAQGDVVADTPKESTTVNSSTSNTIVLVAGSASNNYYSGWWVKVNSDVRYITGYVASTKTLTVSTNFSVTPTNGTTVTLYNRSNAALTWNESNKQFATSFTANDSSTTLTNIDYADLKVASLYALAPISVSDATESSSTSTGSIVTAGGLGVTKALRVGNGIYGTLQTAAQSNITSIGTLSSLSMIGSSNALISISDSSASSVSFPLVVQHQATGTPAIGSGAGIKFNTYDSSSASVSYGRIDAVSESVTAGSHTGKLDFYTTYGGSFVKAMTINSQSSGASTLTINGSGTLSCTIVSSSTMTLNSTTASTSSTVGSMTIAGGISISNATDASSSTNGGTITTAGGAAITKSLYVGGTIYGTLGTVAQAGITSVGTLTSLTVSGNMNLSGHNGSTIGLQLGGTLVTAIASELNVLAGVSGGTASASKALVLNSSSNVSGINSLGTTTLVLGGNSLGATQSGYLTSIIAGTASASKALILDISSNIVGINSLSTTTLIVNGTDISSAISASGYVTGITPGTATASKALVVNSSTNISGVNGMAFGSTTLNTSYSITGDNIIVGAANKSYINADRFRALTLSTITLNNSTTLANGTDSSHQAYMYIGAPTVTATNASITTTNASTLYLASAPVASTNMSITNAYALYVASGTTYLAGNLSMSGTIFSSTQAAYLSSITVGTAAASKALVLDGSSNITGINSLGTTTLVLGSNSLGATESGYLTSISAGTASASKALVLNSSSNISGINSLGTTTLVLGGASLGATQAGYLSSVTAGTASASKALILDISSNITGINSLGTTTLVLGSNNLGATESGYLTFITAGTASATKALVLNVSSSIAGINSISATTLVLGGNTLGATQSGYLSSITAGTAAASKALIMDSSTNISGINAMAFGSITLNTSYSITGDNAVLGSANKSYANADRFRALTLSAVTLNNSFTSSSSTDSTHQSYMFVGAPTLTATNTSVATTTASTFYVASAPIASTNMSITNAYAIYVASGSVFLGSTLSMNGTIFSSTQAGYLSSITIGTAAASKALICDSNTNIAGINSVSTTTLVLGGTSLSGTQSAYLSAITPGTAAASKALIFDVSTNITGIGSVGTTTLVLGGNTLGSTQSSYLTSITAGTAAASKALIFDVSTNITGIGSVGTTTLVLGGNTLGATQSSYLTSITIGTASASKALIFDASTSITGINSLGTTTLVLGSTSLTTTQAAYLTSITIGTAASGKALVADISTNITGINSLGTTTLILGGNSLGATQSGYLTSITAGTASASKALILDSSTNISGINAMAFGSLTLNSSYSITGSSMILGAATKSYTNTDTFRSITANNTTLTNTFTSSSGTDGNHQSYIFMGTPTIAATNTSVTTTNASTLYIASAPVASTNMTLTNTYALYVASGTAYFANSISMAGTTFTATQAGYLSGLTIGTASANKALVLDSSSNITGINSLTAATLVLGSTSLTTTQAAYLTGINIGTASASKALVLDASSNITGINSISTAALVLGGSSLTASQFSALSGVTAGTATASKALILDISSNITGINSLSSTGLIATTSLSIGGTSGSATAWGAAGIQSKYLATNYTDSSTSISGTAALSTFNSFAQPTLLATNTSVTTTNAATIYIANAPVAGTNMTITNSYALYVAAGQSFFAGNVSMNGTIFSSTQAGYLSGLTIGTASASKALVLDSSSNIGGIGSAAFGGLSVLAGFDIYTRNIYINPTNRTYSSFNSFRAITIGTSTLTNNYTASSGTDAFTAACVSLAAPTIAATNTLVTTTNAATVFVGGAPIAGSNMTITNSYALYVSGGKSYFGGNVSMVGPLMLGASTDNGSNRIISGLNSTLSTGTNGTYICFGQSNTTANQAELSFFYGSSGGSTTANRIDFGFNGSVKMSLSTAGYLGINNSTPRYPLDFGASASDSIICLYQNGSTGTYMFGANNSAIEYTSAGSSGHVFYCNTGSTSGALGTKVAAIDTVGNMISMAGLHANSFNTAGLASYGMCAHMHYSSGIGSFFTYNYNTASYGAASFNNVIYVASSGLVGIGTTSPIYSFQVSTSNSPTNVVNYLPYTSSGIAGGATTSPSGVSIYAAGRIVCVGELDVISDRRAKKNITPIDSAYCTNFIKSTVPVQYNYISDVGNNLHYGYIAQDLLHSGYGYGIVTHIDNPDLHYSIDEETGIENPEGVQFVVAYDKVVPIVAKALHTALETIDNHQSTIDNQAQQISDLEARLTKLEALMLR